VRALTHPHPPSVSACLRPGVCRGAHTLLRPPHPRPQGPHPPATHPQPAEGLTPCCALRTHTHRGPTVTELESEAPFEGGGWKCPADKPYAYGGGADCCSEEVDFQAESCTGTTSRCPSGQTRTKMDMCSPIPSTGSSGCAGYCDKHTTSWEWKCFWSAGVCSTCDECTAWNAPVGPRCEPWCERHTKDWTTKCSWKSEVSEAALCDLEPREQTQSQT